MSGDRNHPLEGATPASLQDPPSVAAPATIPVHYTGAALWARRIAVLLFVFLCAGVGVLLIILPWSDQWTDNHLLFAYPQLRTILANGFARGVCSGLGILDIWIGFWEAIHYQDVKNA